MYDNGLIKTNNIEQENANTIFEKYKDKRQEFEVEYNGYTKSSDEEEVVDEEVRQEREDLQNMMLSLIMRICWINVFKNARLPRKIAAAKCIMMLISQCYISEKIRQGNLEILFSGQS